MTTEQLILIVDDEPINLDLLEVAKHDRLGLLVQVGALTQGLNLLIELLLRADELVRIPQAPDGVASLNASCASAVLLHEISRRLSG